MKRFLFVLGLCLVGAGLYLTTPAQATTACGTEFAFYAKNRIAFENGDTNILGNVLVSSPTGLVKVGNQVQIDGRVTAHEIQLGTGVVVKECKADIISGPGVCTDSTSFGTFSGANPVDPTCLIYPEADPVDFGTCDVNTATDQTFFAANNPNTLLVGTGCFGDLKVKDGAILNLSGTYNFKTIRLGAESKVNGPATVNVKGSFTAEPRVELTDLDINSAQQVGEAIFGNSSILSNVTFNAPDTRIHIRTGWLMKNGSELVADALAIQPGDAENGGGENPVCTCEPGFTPEAVVFCIPDVVNP